MVVNGYDAISGVARDSRDSSVDLPAFGKPTSPASAMTLSSSEIHRSSPLSPGSNCRGARLVDDLKWTLPRPPLPPFAATTSSPGSTRSLSTLPRSRSRTMVPGGTMSTMSSAFLPAHFAAMPASPLRAFQCFFMVRPARLSALGSARTMIDPPLPPSPPSGPPFGTYFSRRNVAAPRPPSPPFTKSSTRSTNMVFR